MAKKIKVVKKKAYTTPQAFKDAVNKMLLFWQGKMNLQAYSIYVQYVDKIKDKEYKDGMTAQVSVDTRYLTISVDFSEKFLSLWKHDRKRMMAETICHELVHALTDPYYDLLWDKFPDKLKRQLKVVNERQTELITQALMNTAHPEDFDLW